MTTPEELRAALLDHIQVGIRSFLSHRLAGVPAEEASLLASIVQRTADRTSEEQAAIAASAAFLAPHVQAHLATKNFGGRGAPQPGGAGIPQRSSRRSNKFNDFASRARQLLGEDD